VCSVIKIYYRMLKQIYADIYAIKVNKYAVLSFEICSVKNTLSSINLAT